MGRAATLFELLIALGLMSILMVVLFQFLVGHARVETAAQSKAALQLQRQRLHTRLETLFIGASRLHTDIAGLRAQFDAGVDPDPGFSGPQNGLVRLVDHKLCFVQEAGPKQRSEVLWPDVLSLEWTFFGKDPKGHFAWLSEWPKARAEPPSMIRLCVNHDERFAFILPHQEPLVLR